MQGVLVVVNGGHYYDGHRLDGAEGFNEWRQGYAAGKYDGEYSKGAGATASIATGNGTSVEEEKGQTTVNTKPVGHDIV